jgi:predicted AlkP superfamily phosphohydrolase/phosphomutase
MIALLGKDFSRGLAAGAALGCLAAVIVSIRNPYFVDSLPLGLLLLWACPALFIGLLWVALGALLRTRKSTEGSGTGGRGISPSPGGRPRRGSGGIALVVFVLFAAVIGSLWLTAGLRAKSVVEGSGGPCALVIGMDGATWDIMEPMMKAGELPNLDALRKRGAWGVLTSIEPTLSPAVWTTIATGKKRDKHGIRDFTYTQESLKAPRMWELLEAEGKTVGIQSWLVTWPPMVRRGFQIPGWLARTSETYPPELHFAQDLILGEGLARSPREYLAYLIDAPRIGVRLSTLAEAMRLVAYSKLKHPPLLDLTWRKDELKAAVYADVFCWLLRRYKPDFSAVVFYGTDSLAHIYWKYMERLSSLSGRYGGAAASAGSLSETPAAAKTASPGGEGGAASSEEKSSAASAVSVEDAQRYGDVLRGYYRLVDSYLPRFMAALPPDKTVCVVSDHGHGPSEKEWGYVVLKSSHLLDTMGLTGKVTAASLGDWNFLSPAPGHGVEALEDAAQTLSSLKVARTGQPFLDIQMTGSQSLSMRADDDVTPTDTLVTQQGLRLPAGDFLTETGLSGTHRLNGVIILSGRGVKRGSHIENASLPDVAPTLLYLMGSTVGQDMDGRVLEENIAKDFLDANPIRTVPSRDGEVKRPGAGREEELPEAVRERLRALGYVK